MADTPLPILCFQAVITGRVQGVGYRQATLALAQELGLGGWVRNQWDGSVLVTAEGPELALQRLLAWLHSGPRMAHVERVTVQWMAPLAPDTLGPRAFEVR